VNKSRVTFAITVAILIFLYLPIVVLIVQSFNESRFGGVWTGFSLKWYSRLMVEKPLWNSLTNSLIIASTATVVSTILGTTAAYALYRYKSKLQQANQALIYGPLFIPDILMGISLLLFFIAVNMQLGLFTIFITHTTFCISYVTMVVLARLHNFDYSMIEAAQDLGANSFTIARKVLIPLIAPGMIAGALLAFTISLDDFIITYFVAGPGSTTLPIYVYGMIKFGATPLINALSTILLAITFLIVWFTRRLMKDDPI
jgi:spermidine/putrescine transport system permease protein